MVWSVIEKQGFELEKETTARELEEVIIRIKNRNN